MTQNCAATTAATPSTPLAAPEDFNLNDLLDTDDGCKASDDICDLDKLLNESMSAKADAKKIQEARKRLASKGLILAERELLIAIVRGWERKREWTPSANVLMFDVQYCTACGGVHKHFQGFFQQQEHKTSKISRWIQAEIEVELPKALKETIVQVGICSACCTEKGWL